MLGHTRHSRKKYVMDVWGCLNPGRFYWCASMSMYGPFSFMGHFCISSLLENKFHFITDILRGSSVYRWCVSTWSKPDCFSLDKAYTAEKSHRWDKWGSAWVWLEQQAQGIHKDFIGKRWCLSKHDEHELEMNFWKAHSRAPAWKGWLVEQIPCTGAGTIMEGVPDSTEHAVSPKSFCKVLLSVCFLRAHQWSGELRGKTKYSSPSQLRIYIYIVVEHTAHEQKLEA